MPERRRIASLQIKTADSEASLGRPLIDPEIVHSVFYEGYGPAEDLRRAEFWDNVGASYSDSVRGILHKANVIRQDEGDMVADAYIKGATDVMRAFGDQSELSKRLAA